LRNPDIDPVQPKRCSWIFNSPILSTLLFLLVGFVIYSNSLDSPFYFDDLRNIKNNPHIRLNSLSWSEITGIASSKSANRFLPLLSFGLNYYFDRYNVFGYHLVNVLIHVLNGILLFHILSHTLQLSGIARKPDNDLIAFLSALIWLVHPLQIQSVTYIVQRMNSMMAFFYLLSLLLFIKGRKKAIENEGPARYFPYFTGAALSGICSFFCKESAVTLPFFLILYEVFFFSKQGTPFSVRKLKWLLPAFLPVPPVLYVAIKHFPADPGTITFSFASAFPFERLITIPRVISRYISLLFYPHPSRLNFDYDFPLSGSLLDPPGTILSLLLIIVLVATAVLFRKRAGFISFCILWFFGTLAIESFFVMLDIIFEHRLYLPSTFFLAGVTVLLVRTIRNRVVYSGLFVFVIFVCSIWTWQRNEAWRDAEAFWSDNVRKSLLKARPHNNLGLALMEAGKFTEAQKHFETALKLDPAYHQSYTNLGNLFQMENEFNKALFFYVRAIEINPIYTKAYNNLGGLLYNLGRLNEATYYLEKLIKMDPDNESGLNNLGLVYRQQGKLEKAKTNFKNAIDLNNECFDAYLNLGNLLIMKDSFVPGIANLNKALQLNPDSEKVYNSMGVAFLKKGSLEDALKNFTKAVKLKPDYPDAYNNMGIAWEYSGNELQAVRSYIKALEIAPANPDIQSNLREIIMKHGGPEKGSSFWIDQLGNQSQASQSLEKLKKIIFKSGQ
jgi:protein O-mannosyl-transferase